MSKIKELFIIGATAASCAIAGYAFYQNNENDQDQRSAKGKNKAVINCIYQFSHGYVRN